jgi:hypothetical protein
MLGRCPLCDKLGDAAPVCLYYMPHICAHGGRGAEPPHGGRGGKAPLLFYYIYITTMSIVALKRNSRRFQVPISANGFALNGTRRNIGSVGQTNLAKSVTRTPFRGAAPMGHGTCCGSYPKIISNSGSCCVNDPTIIKKSTKNTLGHIYESIKYPVCDNGNCAQGSQSTWVKNMTAENNSQGFYIHNVIALAGACVLNTNNNNPIKNPIKPCVTDCFPGNSHIGGKKHFVGAYTKDLGLNNAASEYIRSQLMRYNCLPTPSCKQHFPMTLNHDGCDANYLTPEAAQAAGLLPPNWMKQPCVL